MDLPVRQSYEWLEAVVPSIRAVEQGQLGQRIGRSTRTRAAPGPAQAGTGSRRRSPTCWRHMAK